jgi:protein SCO1
MRLTVLLILSWLTISAPLARADSAAAGTEPAPPVQQYQEYVPPELRDVGVIEKTGQTLPLDLQFVDQNGKTVTLAEYFDGTKPVLLQLGYFECPQLCGMVSQAMADALREQTLKLGDDYRILYVSFDPNETFMLAAQKRQSILEAAGKDRSSPGLYLLTGNEPQIKRLTDAVGFKYKWVESQQLYSHSAAIIFLTPQGKVSRYLFGVKFDPQLVRLGLVEASEGKIGTAADQYLLTCLPFGGTGAKHSAAAKLLMQTASVSTVAVLLFMIMRTVRQTRAHLAAEAAAQASVSATSEAKPT